MIVVIDTNVWISALQFASNNGPPGLALERAAAEDMIAIADDLEAELYRILIVKFQWSPRRVREALDVVIKQSIRVTLRHNLHICRDPKDDMFLECAALAQADVLVSGDKDLLTLGAYAGTRILTPLQYLDPPA